MAKLTQEELQDIFNAIKKLLKPYGKGNIKCRADNEANVDLWSEKKNMDVYGRKRDEIQFAALVVQNNYVGFYFMPYYANPEGLKQHLAPELLKCLKGKACFHIKTTDKQMLAAIKDALKLGYEEYKKKGWV